MRSTGGLRRAALHRTGPCLAAALAMQLLAAPAEAKVGTGDYFRRRIVSRVEHYQSLARLGDDAIRVTLGRFERVGWTLELHPQKHSRGHVAMAVGEVFLHEATPRGVLPAGWIVLRMRLDDYDKLMADVDQLLARGDPRDGAGLGVVCADPDSYIVERRRHGKTRWVYEDCGSDMPAADVVYRIAEAFPFPLCWYTSAALDDDACKSIRPPTLGYHADEQADAGERKSVTRVIRPRTDPMLKPGE